MLDLAPHQLQLLLRILQQHVPDVTVWAFGSRVNGNAKPHSDLDLVLKTAIALPQQRLFALQDALEESDLPIKVDVLDWQHISPDFQQHILQHYLVLPRQ